MFVAKVRYKHWRRICFYDSQLMWVVALRHFLNGQQRVLEISVATPSVFQPHVCGLGNDQAMLFQRQHVLAHRVLIHIHRTADGPATGPALVGPAFFTATQVTVHCQFPDTDAQLKHLVGYREVVVLLPHTPPLVCDSTHWMKVPLYVRYHIRVEKQRQVIVAFVLQ